MAFSLNAQRRSQRHERFISTAKEIVRGLMEPFILEDLYPDILIPDPDNPGRTKVIHDIQPHQRLIHNWTAPSGKKPKYLLASQAVGTGKTMSCAAHIVKLARTCPGIHILVVCPYDWYFDEIVMPVFWSIVPPPDGPGGNRHIRKYGQKIRTVWWVNGSKIKFAAYDEASKIKGTEYHFIWIEEAAQLGGTNNEKADEIFKALNMRLRRSKPDYPLQMLISQNPYGHNWCWKYFVKDEIGKRQPLGDVGHRTVWGKNEKGEDRWYAEFEKEDVNGDVYYTISCPSRGNKFLKSGYIETMLGQMADDPRTRDRMVEGSFTPINTLVYDFPNYSESTHLLDYQTFLDMWEIPYIPSHWPIIVGVDAGGRRSPWAVEFYAQVPDGSHWVCFDEIYVKGASWMEVADMIWDKSHPFEDGYGYENIEYWSDPISSQQQHGPDCNKIIDWFLEQGLRFEAPKHYTKAGGVESVVAHLRPNRRLPSPYYEDVETFTEDGSSVWTIGKCGIYYLTNVPGTNRMVMMPDGSEQEMNPERHACPSNIAEKRVWRWDDKKQRQSKEAEEGLTPFQSQKIMDRDDHAQTAEMFCFLGKYPVDLEHSRRQRTLRKQEQRELVYQYGMAAKFMGRRR